MKQSALIFVVLVLVIASPACSGDEAVQEEAATTSGDSEAMTVAESPSTASAEDAPLSPEETLQRLIELARAGDWETYVDDFYGESDKFEGLAERRDAVVARFRDRWAADVLAGLEALDEGAAVITDDGKRAVFSRNGEPSFDLFLSDDGRWTFHL